MRNHQVLGGRYRLDGEIGRGGMAVVWRAEDEVLGRPVAVKVLAGQYAADPEARTLIREEARAAARLSHPNIAQVHDFGEARDGDDILPYVVMELISGISLARRLREGPLSLEAALRCCAEVAAALTAAHEDGLVHRDIKPANVMLTRQGAKVVDFGIAAVATPGTGGGPVGVPMGTPAYIAPERLTGDGVYPATDVYALGVLLYLLISGGSPWDAESITEMLDAHVYTEPDPLPSLPHVPTEVVDLCHRCLRKDPAERPGARDAAVVLAVAAGSRIVTGGVRAVAPEGTADEPEAADHGADVLADPLSAVIAGLAAASAHGAPADPDAAVSGEAVARPGSAVRPDAAGSSGVSARPDDPGDSARSGLPAPLGAPGLPGVVALPGASGLPGVPELPGVPALPGVPELPAVAALPGVPALPDSPVNADRSVYPDLPAGGGGAAYPDPSANPGGAAYPDPSARRGGPAHLDSSAHVGDHGFAHPGGRAHLDGPAHQGLPAHVGGPAGPDGSAHRGGPARLTAAGAFPGGPGPRPDAGHALARPSADRRRRRVIVTVAAGLLTLLAAAGVTTTLLSPDELTRTAPTPAPANSAGADAPAPGGTGPAGGAPDDSFAGNPAPGPVPSGPSNGQTSAQSARSLPAQVPATASATNGPVAAETSDAPAPPPAPQPQPQQRTLSSAGGSVDAACTAAGQASLVSYEASKPYKVNTVDPGPAEAAEIVFRHGNRLVTMTVTCDGGVPSAAVTEGDR